MVNFKSTLCVNLTYQRPLLPSHRNQLLDLFCKLDGSNGLSSFYVPFHIETSHLLCGANQMTGLYMKCSTRLKCVILVKKFNESYSTNYWTLRLFLSCKRFMEKMISGEAFLRSEVILTH